MAVTIDGTVGVISPDFIPSSSNIPTNGLFLPTTNALGLATNSTERLRLDASGNVGIGTSSPTYKLDVSSAASSTIARFTGGSSSVGFFQNNLGANNSYFAFGVDATGSTVGWSTGGIFISSAANGTGTAYDLILQQYMAKSIIFATSNTERARIDSSGNLLVGTTSNPNGARFYARYDGITTQIICNSASTSSASTNWSHFVGQSGNGSSITTNNIFIYGNGNIQNANNSYAGISDFKLKENITDATPKLNDLCKVRVVNYNFKGDYERHKQLGVIAQELEQIFPGLVDETQDRDAEGNLLETTTKSVKYSVFVPMLVKAIQELTARLEALEAK